MHESRRPARRVTAEPLRRPRRGGLPGPLSDAFRAALAPVVACGLALGGLTTWVALGRAGSPPRIEVTAGRVFLPFGENRETAAFFRIANPGGAQDLLVDITSSAVEGGIALSRHRTTDDGAAYREETDSVAVPAFEGLTMSPHGVDVTVRADAAWRSGSLVPFTLHFRHSGPKKVLAVVVRPGEGGAL